MSSLLNFIKLIKSKHFVLWILYSFRFYNHDSAFLHGGLDRPGQETRRVIGQQVFFQYCFVIYKMNKTVTCDLQNAQTLLKKRLNVHTIL